MSASSEYEVVIIGSGPSGCIAASCLARAGIRVLMLEKGEHPREVVGEGILPHVWSFLDAANVGDKIREEGFLRKRGGIGYWDGIGRYVDLAEYGFKKPALHVERDVFDNILADHIRSLDVAFLERAKVTRVDNLEDAPVVRYRHEGEDRVVTCRYVIDASGQAAVVSRQLGIREFDNAMRFSAFWSYFESSHYVTIEPEIRPFEERYDEPPATLISSIGEWGWIWHIVLRNKVSVGVILPRERINELRGSSEEERRDRFNRLLSDAPFVGQLLRGHELLEEPVRSIRDYSYRPVRLAVGRCFICGDAAAFVDPINSAGVPFGMFAGHTAAWAIRASLRDESKRDVYRGMFERSYGDRLALFRVMGVPEGMKLFEKEELERAKRAIAMSSAGERGLMLNHAMLTNRSEALRLQLRELGMDADLGLKEVRLPVRG